MRKVATPVAPTRGSRRVRAPAGAPEAEPRPEPRADPLAPSHSRVPPRSGRSVVALLRAVNVGGSGRVQMADLRQLLSAMGFATVRTVLQSGNVVFGAGEEATERIERRVEAELRRALGVETDLFVRSADEWRELIRRNPFPREAERDPSHLVVALLRTAPEARQWDALRGSITGREQVRGFARHAYLVYPDGIRTSPVTAAWIERQLGTRSTSRNWNGVTKIAELLSG
jgi:uncharacterized protein (DUF1697 family)